MKGAPASDIAAVSNCLTLVTVWTHDRIHVAIISRSDLRDGHNLDSLLQHGCSNYTSLDDTLLSAEQEDLIGDLNLLTQLTLPAGGSRLGAW